MNAGDDHPGVRLASHTGRLWEKVFRHFPRSSLAQTDAARKQERHPDWRYTVKVSKPDRFGLRVPNGLDLIRQVNAAALPRLETLCQHWLPNGRREGREYVALNPMRHDRSLGSFRINLMTGRWADFASSDRGGDPVSLYAFLNSVRQVEAARQLAAQLGVAQ